MDFRNSKQHTDSPQQPARNVSLDSMNEEDIYVQKNEVEQPPIPKSINEETHEQPQGSRIGFYIEMTVILTVLFFAESSRGMVMPSLNLYVDYVGRLRK